MCFVASGKEHHIGFGRAQFDSPLTVIIITRMSNYDLLMLKLCYSDSPSKTILVCKNS